MNQAKALAFLQALANGIDPISGEVFPEDSPYQQVDVVRALFYALDLLKQTKPQTPAKEVPTKAGQPWAKEEDQRLTEAFQAGKPIAQLAERHGRTSGAIRSRLQKLGLVDAVDFTQ